MSKEYMPTKAGLALTVVASLLLLGSVVADFDSDVEETGGLGYTAIVLISILFGVILITKMRQDTAIAAVLVMLSLGRFLDALG